MFDIKATKFVHHHISKQRTKVLNGGKRVKSK